MDCSDVQHLGILVPRAVLAAMVPGVELAAMRPIGRTDPTLRLLRRYLKTLPANAGPALYEAASRHICDLVSLLVGADGEAADEARERGVASANLASIKADISRDVATASIGTLAGCYGVTNRYIQKLLERDGQTFSAYRLELQVTRAFAMLRDPTCSHMTIAAIALDCGFSDTSYFNRVFKRRFGDTPSGVRRSKT
jgi:AraC-like DNA-binding protein